MANLDNLCSHRLSSQTCWNAKVDYTGIFVIKAKLEGIGKMKGITTIYA